MTGKFFFVHWHFSSASSSTFLNSKPLNAFPWNILLSTHRLSSRDKNPAFPFKVDFSVLEREQEFEWNGISFLFTDCIFTKSPIQIKTVQFYSITHYWSSYRFSDVFSGYKNGALTRNELKVSVSLHTRKWKVLWNYWIHASIDRTRKKDDGDNEINVIVDYNEEKEDSEKVQPKKKIMQS